MNIEDLTAEQKEKAKGLKTPEEMLEFAKSEGIELSEEQLEDIAGDGHHVGSKFIWED
ncbi:MAG: hypothetical protein IJ092_01430 [Atopobiaceae bacterium]|nr:hypothetical protein [Atopobiaceae bacterium]